MQSMARGDKLSPKQERFCMEYIKDLNATQAAIRAGYAPKRAGEQGYGILQSPKAKAFLDEIMAAKNKELIADQDEILKYLTSVMRGENKSIEIVVEGTGDGTSAARTMEKEPSEKDRLRAAELLGKRYGLYTDKVNIETAIPVVITGVDALED